MKTRSSSPSHTNKVQLDSANWLAAIVESSDDAIVGKTLDGNHYKLEPRRRAYLRIRAA